MTLQLVQERLDALLTDRTARVVLLTGEWGTGKTYQWNLARARFKGEKPRYAYVSLFGLTSIADLRRRIAEEAGLSFEIGWGRGADDAHNTTTVKPGFFAKFMRLTGGSGTKAEELITELIFTQVRDAIICIDDLERGDKATDIGAVLGLANYLKEERNCRVLLVSNQKKLNEDGKKALLGYMEKVIDERVELAPSIDEAVAIAFGTATDPATTLVRARARQLMIGNIRVLRQVERLARVIHTELAGLHERVRDEAVQAAALFGACHLQGRDDLPTTDYLFELEDNWVRYFAEVKKPREQKTDEDRQHEKWKAMLQEYGYVLTSALDKEVGKTMIRGYLDTTTLRSVAEAHSQAFVDGDLQGQLTQAIKNFWHGFAVDGATAVRQVHEAALKAVSVAGLSTINHAWSILMDVDAKDEATKLLEAFIESNQQRPAVFAEVNGHFREHYESEFGERVRREAEKLHAVPTVEEALDRIKFDQGWSSDDVARVCEATAEEIEGVLKSATADNFRSRVTVLQNLPSMSQNAEQARKVAEKTTDILVRWAQSDQIMAVRLRQYLPKDFAAKSKPQAK